jgi:hypothetical protein
MAAATVCCDHIAIGVAPRSYDDELALKFRRIVLDDPAVRRLANGYILWGDIPITPAEEAFHSQWAAEQRVEQQKQPTPHEGATAPLSPRSSSPVFIPFDEEAATWQAVKRVPAVRAVPPFTVGIKTLIARNLPRDITVEALRAVFEKYGPIKDIYIPKNMEKTSPLFGTVKGFALVKFLKPEDSASAFEAEYSRITIGDNHVSLEFAKEDR